MTQVSTGNFAWWLSLINPRSEHPTIQGPQGDEIAWRIAQMIFGAPIPALFVYEITVLFLGALPSPRSIEAVPIPVVSNNHMGDDPV